MMILLKLYDITNTLNKIISNILVLTFVYFFYISDLSAKENSLTCINIASKVKANIIYGKNFAKEEMSPNIWLFFQKIKFDENFLNIISLDENIQIREWKINLISGEAILTPMFDPSSKWICKI